PRRPSASDLSGGSVPAIAPGGGELAQLVPDHSLGDEDRDVLATVVHCDRVADHLGEDGRGPRPGLDHLLLARLVHRLDARHQALLDPGPLLAGTTHRFLPLRRPRTM